MGKKYNDDQAIAAIKKHHSWREAAYSLGLNGDAGGNTKTLKTIAKKHNTDVSHLKGQGWNLGKSSTNAIPLDSLLKKGVRFRSNSLKKKLLKAGKIKEICDECDGGNIWQNKKLVLELDHIDGDKENNLIENLRLLCPNCHSQTHSFRGRKKK